MTLEQIFVDPDLSDPNNPKIQLEDGSCPLLLRACGRIYVQQEMDGTWAVSLHNEEGKVLTDLRGEIVVGLGVTLLSAIEDLELELEFL